MDVINKTIKNIYQIINCKSNKNKYGHYSIVFLIKKYWDKILYSFKINTKHGSITSFLFLFFFF